MFKMPRIYQAPAKTLRVGQGIQAENTSSTCKRAGFFAKYHDSIARLVIKSVQPRNSSFVWQTRMQNPMTLRASLKSGQSGAGKAFVQSAKKGRSVNVLTCPDWNHFEIGLNDLVDYLLGFSFPDRKSSTYSFKSPFDFAAEEIHSQHVRERHSKNQHVAEVLDVGRRDDRAEESEPQEQHFEDSG